MIGCHVLGAAFRGDVTAEAESVRFVAPSAQPAGEFQRFSGMAGGLADPPG
jgi:hypothetical protein